MSLYGKVEYWEDRYKKDPEQFDWFQPYQNIKEQITSNITQESKILNVGAGSSKLSEEMYDEGFQYIVNIDFSANLIKIMQEKHKNKESTFYYTQMDVRNMSDFYNGQFDCVIDKGTLDSVYCSDTAIENSNKMLSEIYRVLKAKGVYICISHGQPETRLPQFENPNFNWKVKQFPVNKPSVSIALTIAAVDKEMPNIHYVYVCNKNDNESLDN